MYSKLKRKERKLNLKSSKFGLKITTSISFQLFFFYRELPGIQMLPLPLL